MALFAVFLGAFIATYLYTLTKLSAKSAQILIICTAVVLLIPVIYLSIFYYAKPSSAYVIVDPSSPLGNSYAMANLSPLSALAALSSSSSNPALFDEREYCGDGPCSEHGRCFLGRCFCDPFFSGSFCATPCPSCTTPQAGHIALASSSVFSDIFKRNMLTWMSPAAGDEKSLLDSHLHHTVGFAWYSSLPVDIGTVLEIGAGCFPHIEALLRAQHRRVTSITIIEPLMNIYSHSFPFCSYAHNEIQQTFSSAASSSSSDGSFSSSFVDPHNGALIPAYFLSSHFESFSFSSHFDTILFVDVLPYVRDVFVFLTSVYSALKPGGYLLFYERTFDDFIYKASADTQRSDDFIQFRATHPTTMKKEFLQYFLSLFEIRYENDAKMRSKFNIPTSTMHSSHAEARYVIARKRSVLEAYPRPGEYQPVVPKKYQFIDHFYLIWTAAGLDRWRYHVLDSIYHHHPTATVHIYTQELQYSQFQPFIDAGLALQLHYVNFTEFFAYTPLERWSQINYYHYNYRVHVSDAFRLTITWKYGGVYIDFDFFVLNRLYGLRNMIAHEVMPGMLNGALLIGDAGHPWLQLSMIHFPSVHNISIWHSSGPLLQSHMMSLYEKLDPALVRRKAVPEPSDPFQGNRLHALVNVYFPNHFYPHAWWDARLPKFWLRELLNQTEVDWSLNYSYGFHVWTAMVGGYLKGETNYIDPDNFIGQLVLKNCKVLCEDFLKRNPRGAGYPQYNDLRRKLGMPEKN